MLVSAAINENDNANNTTYLIPVIDVTDQFYAYCFVISSSGKTQVRPNCSFYCQIFGVNTNFRNYSPIFHILQYARLPYFSYFSDYCHLSEKYTIQTRSCCTVQQIKASGVLASVVIVELPTVIILKYVLSASNFFPPKTGFTQ